jgi:hypothetical protein
MKVQGVIKGSNIVLKKVDDKKSLFQHTQKTARDIGLTSL